MTINIHDYFDSYDFKITGVSYIGRPKSNTVMYVVGKVSYLVQCLESVKECLVFVEKGVDVSPEIANKNVIIYCDNPSKEYATFAELFYKEKMEIEKSTEYLKKDGSLVSKNAVIGNNCFIEPGCYIGNNVVIGDNVYIRSGAVLRDCEIGDNTIINEYAVVGSMAFTMGLDSNLNRTRIPSLGKVILGNNVEIGAYTSIAVGAAGETIIGNYSKLDAHVLVGHDAIISENVEIAAGAMIAGFTEIRKKSFVGLNSTIKNRIIIGEDCFVSMGSIVEKSVKNNHLVVSAASKHFEKRS